MRVHRCIGLVERIPIDYSFAIFGVQILERWIFQVSEIKIKNELL
jgi:hypothetical protein